jgi:hypothetical protein
MCFRFQDLASQDYDGLQSYLAYLTVEQRAAVKQERARRTSKMYVLPAVPIAAMRCPLPENAAAEKNDRLS